MSLLLPPPVLETLYNSQRINNDLDIEEGVNTNDFPPVMNDRQCCCHNCRYNCRYNCDNIRQIDWLSILNSSYLKWTMVFLFIVFFVIGMAESIYQYNGSVEGNVFLIISSILAFSILLFIITNRIFCSQLDNNINNVNI